MLSLPNVEKSLWRDSYPDKPLYPAIKNNLEVDVAIVGGGVTGLTTSYLLKQSGKRVAVLEKDTIGSGTSGRTTGKVTSQHNLIYTDMVKRLGKHTARAYAQANQSAVARVEEIVKNENIECDWQADKNYIFTTTSGTVRSLREEAGIAARLGLPANYVLHTPLPFKVKGAVEFADQGKINMQKYLLGLAKLVSGDESYVFENSKVTDFHDGKPSVIKANGHYITAQAIVVATKVPTYPLLARFGYALLEYPTESFAIACPVSKSIPGMYISPDDEHPSILPFKANGRQNILFVGAGGNIPGLRLSKPARYRHLAEYARSKFGIEDITHTWSDMDYLPYDGFPLVGKVYPWSKHMYTASGYMKWGLSNGTAAAMILHDVIVGQPNPWSKYFSPRKVRPLLNIPRAIYRHVA